MKRTFENSLEYFPKDLGIVSPCSSEGCGKKEKCCKKYKKKAVYCKKCPKI